MTYAHWECQLTRETVKKTVLASLYWSGDELWCSSLKIGYIDFWRGPDGLQESPIDFHATKNEARAALEAAARKQIENWLKDQAE